MTLPNTPEEIEKDLVCHALTNGLDEVTARWAYRVAGNFLIAVTRVLPPITTPENLGRVMKLLTHAVGVISASAAVLDEEAKEEA